MKAYLFPGQGAQFEGMGRDLYEQSSIAKDLFELANEILGFRITDVMFHGNAEELKQTHITQPAIFLHSVIRAKMEGDNFVPQAVAGHSLGEFSALVAAGAVDFPSGLKLVKARANAMQEACEKVESTMAAIIGLDDEIVEKTCSDTDGIVVPANYNAPGQLVISGERKAVESAVEKLNALGAAKSVILSVGGAFHSPLMQPAQEKLAQAIAGTIIQRPICPVYQNITALAETDVQCIRENLIKQLTGPVLWTKTLQQMIADGVTEFIEVGGSGKVLQGMVKKIDRKFPTSALI